MERRIAALAKSKFYCPRSNQLLGNLPNQCICLHLFPGEAEHKQPCNFPFQLRRVTC